MSYRATLTTVCLAIGLATSSGAQRWPGRDRLEAESCRPLAGDARLWLARADSALGRHHLGDRVLTLQATESDDQFFQSDRPYPPFIGASQARRYWYHPLTGVERFGPPGIDGRARDVLRAERMVFMVRDTTIMPVPPAYTFFEPGRALNPLAVLHDWIADGAARVAERCQFRDYPRVVLTKPNGHRLYLDEKTATPIKFERVESHQLWGQVRAEYVYATYWQTGPVTYPLVAVRFIDGVQHLRRDVSLPQAPGDATGKALAATESPRLTTPPGPTPPAADPGALPAVDTIRVGPNTFLLKTRAYTHAVALAKDTIFLFDATTSEARSRADSAWIGKLFPGRYPVTLVVTDLAWPHISGLRFWAARGARIVTHARSREMLTQVLDRRWTLEPDLLERNRPTKAIKLVTTTDGLDFAGGAVRVRVIDGFSSEGAVMGYIAADEFLWGSDYIQTVTDPSPYAREVVAAARRAGLTPRHAAAQHLPLTPWATIVSSSGSP